MFWYKWDSKENLFQQSHIVCLVFSISRDLKGSLTPGVVGTSTKDTDTLFYCQTLFNSEEDTEVHIQVMLPG